MTVPLNYLSYIWQLLEIPLIKCKIELKLRWSEHCILAVADAENDGAHSNEIIFIIKHTKLHVPAVILSTKNNQKILKPFGKRFERSVSWNEYKT